MRIGKAAFKTREQLAEEGRRIREKYARYHNGEPEFANPAPTPPPPPPSFRRSPAPPPPPSFRRSSPPPPPPQRPFDPHLWERRVHEARARRAEEERELRERREQTWREQARTRQAQQEEHLRRERERAERQRQERERDERQRQRWERAYGGGGDQGGGRMRPELSPRDAQWLLDTIGYKSKRFQDMTEGDMPEFKRAYKKAVLRLHPDKVKQRGGSDQEVSAADEAFKRVHEVYAEIVAMFDKHLDAMLDALYAIRHRVATLERAFSGGVM